MKRSLKIVSKMLYVFAFATLFLPAFIVSCSSEKEKTSEGADTSKVDTISVGMNDTVDSLNKNGEYVEGQFDTIGKSMDYKDSLNAKR